MRDVVGDLVGDVVDGCDSSSAASAVMEAVSLSRAQRRKWNGGGGGGDGGDEDDDGGRQGGLDASGDAVVLLRGGGAGGSGGRKLDGGPFSSSGALAEASGGTGIITLVARDLSCWVMEQSGVAEDPSSLSVGSPHSFLPVGSFDYYYLLASEGVA